MNPSARATRLSRACAPWWWYKWRGVGAGIDAAHVRWFTFDGPDELDNGLALCVLTVGLRSHHANQMILVEGDPVRVRLRRSHLSVEG
jgi:hypothetical protein